ncbi:amino acid/amide ABC transporter substrate-binding protein, HAAT family [Pedobacter westerhofensis]|uniref:Amino acid/amide ABC transporter substrate-binding protein, HAAT family n=1 Tax=Pedobacter westerhofensis TaxID=425512 RepID=A0A521ATU5_9SPHI|nr:amino acid ABC transporter substrate-binding protein [Pedobacter westerhofensis]SMO38227.1 amino acid/amide ABC transporter substrate-binding protein, HAAT family [Pedobacter westerhofensis]
MNVQSNETIRIGYSLSLTGPVAENTKSARLAHRLWEEDINLKGGLLGKPVALICIDDQGDASKVPEIYKRLLDLEKVDLLLGGYGTNTLKASLPIVMERKRILIGLMGLGVNGDLQYPDYFAMIPTGPNPNTALTEVFFELAAAQEPKPLTVALLTADAEFSRNPVLGARENAEKYNMTIIHEQTYPLSTTDFKPIIAQLKEINADILFLCSYLNDSKDLIRAIHNSNYRPKMVGGAMIGPQSAAVKTELGPLLNGFVNYEYWMPVPNMDFPGVADVLQRYQARASAAKVDELGFYVVPLAYAQLQVLAQAIRATGSLDDALLSEYCRENSFETVMGTIKFGKGGEWAAPRVLQVQFQHVENGGLATFRDNRMQVVVSPEPYASGNLIYPYDPSK